MRGLLCLPGQIYTSIHKVPTPAYVVPIVSSVLAQFGENKHVGGAGLVNQNQAFKHSVIFLPEQK